jgi:hypothetical protein
MDAITPTKEHRRRESLRRIVTSTSDDGVLAASSPLTATTEGGRSDSRSEPRSEYLRKALQDRKDARSRPKPAEEPSNAPDRVESPLLRRRARTPSPVRNLPSPEPSLVGDDWTRDVLEEERPSRSRAPATVRKPRRSSATGLRTSEASPFAGTPSKDTQAKLDRLSNENFNLKHRLTLQQDQVKQLVEKLELALEEIKALRKADEEKEEANKQLQQEVLELEVELDEREAEIHQLQVERTELFSLQDELAKEMEKRDEAIDEATEMIMQAEEECERVKAELEALRQERAATAAATPKEIDSDYYSAEAERDSPWRHARTKPSTDSKLSAGLSDYYSGPNSPYVQPHSEPLPVVPPPHLIPPECVPERKLGPLSQRARTIAQQKSISSAALRKRISCASEATESVVDSIDVNGSTPSLARRPQGQALPLIRQHSSEFDLPAINEAPKTRRGAPFRARQSTRGLRGLFQKGEHTSPTRQGRSSAMIPVVDEVASAPVSPALSMQRATSSYSDPNNNPHLLAARPVTREGSINTISTVSTTTSTNSQLERHSTTTPDRHPRHNTGNSYQHIRQPSTDPRPQQQTRQQHYQQQLPPAYKQQSIPYRPHQVYPSSPSIIQPPPTTPTAYPGATSFYHSTSTINSQLLVDSPCLTPGASSAGGARDFFFNPDVDFASAVVTATEVVGGGSVESLRGAVQPARTRRRYGHEV